MAELHEENDWSVALWMDGYIANSEVVRGWFQEESYQKAMV